MRVISYGKLRDFATIHPDAREVLRVWYKVASKSRFASFAELKATFGQVDYVNGLCVFNIGTFYRLIVKIHFNRQCLYVRYVLTHAEYDRGKWK